MMSAKRDSARIAARRSAHPCSRQSVVRRAVVLSAIAAGCCSLVIATLTTNAKAGPAATCSPFTMVYTRQFSAETWRYTIRINHVAAHGTICRTAHSVIGGADSAFAKIQPGPGVDVSVG